MSETEIKWTDTCLRCQSEHNGVCVSPACKQRHYDEWGDKIPNEVYYMDGNDIQEYIEQKRKRMADKQAELSKFLRNAKMM